RLDALADRMRSEIHAAADATGLAVMTPGVGSAFGLYVLEEPGGEIDWEGSALLHLAAVTRGVYYGSGGEVGLCTALDDGTAGAALGFELRGQIGRTGQSVSSTTQATNAILQARSPRTALLRTEGFPDILVRREGGSMHPYDFSRPYPDPYIPRHLTFEIRER